MALTRNLEKVKAGPVVAEPEGSDMSLRKVPRPFDLHWGKGVIAEEASVVTPFHEPAIQLLAFEDGSRSLRFCAYHKGSFARMPLIVGEENLEALAKEVKRSPQIRKLLKKLVD